MLEGKSKVDLIQQWNSRVELLVINITWSLRLSFSFIKYTKHTHSPFSFSQSWLKKSLKWTKVLELEKIITKIQGFKDGFKIPWCSMQKELFHQINIRWSKTRIYYNYVTGCFSRGILCTVSWCPWSKNETSNHVYLKPHATQSFNYIFFHYSGINKRMTIFSGIVAFSMKLLLDLLVL